MLSFQNESRYERCPETSLQKIALFSCLEMVHLHFFNIYHGQVQTQINNSSPPRICRQWHTNVVIFFSLTEAPLPDPTPTPPNTPKRTRNGPETDPKRSQTEPNGAETEPNGAEMDRNQAFRGGTGGGFVGVGGWGVVREKENHHTNDFKQQAHSVHDLFALSV